MRRSLLLSLVGLSAPLAAVPAAYAGGPSIPSPDLVAEVTATPGQYSVMTGKAVEPVVTLTVKVNPYGGGWGTTTQTSTRVRVCAEALRPILPFAVPRRCLWAERAIGVTTAPLSAYTGFKVNLLSALSAPLAVSTAVTNPYDKGRTTDSGGFSPVRIRVVK